MAKTVTIYATIDAYGTVNTSTTSWALAGYNKLIRKS